MGSRDLLLFLESWVQLISFIFVWLFVILPQGACLRSELNCSLLCLFGILFGILSWLESSAVHFSYCTDKVMVTERV